MRGDRVLFLFIRGVLHRGKLNNVVFLRHDNDAARVLARGALHAHAACNKAFCLAFVKAHALLLTIPLDVAVDRLILQAGNCACTEGMPFAEHFLHVLMRNRLIFTGKVQVDIGRFIPLEAQEHFKRDLVAEFFVFRAAHGAVCIRHVHATCILRAVYVEIAVFAVGAHVMRLEGIHLRDARHRSHKR